MAVHAVRPERRPPGDHLPPRGRLPHRLSEGEHRRRSFAHGALRAHAREGRRHIREDVRHRRRQTRHRPGSSRRRADIDRRHEHRVILGDGEAARSQRGTQASPFPKGQGNRPSMAPLGPSCIQGRHEARPASLPPAHRRGLRPPHERPRGPPRRGARDPRHVGPLRAGGLHGPR